MRVLTVYLIVILTALVLAAPSWAGWLDGFRPVS